MFTAMRDPTKKQHLTGREIYTCVISLAGNPDTNEQIKKVEHFCGFYSAMNQDEKKRAIYQQLTGHLPPASVNEAKALALSERPLTGRELGDVAQRQNREIATYRAAVNAWFADCDNNWEHVIPQETLVLHYRGQNQHAAQFVAKANGVVTHTALTYFENQRRHQRHTGTRWLIIDKKNHRHALSLPADTHVQFQYSRGFYYQHLDGSERIYNFMGQPLMKVNCSPETSLDAILSHEVKRKKYEKLQSALLRKRGDAGSAIVLNQRCYAADPLWQQERLNGHAASKSDAVADVSFYQAIARCDSVTYISDTSDETQESLTLTRIALTEEDKRAAIVARLTATLGRESSPEEIREIMARFGVDLP